MRRWRRARIGFLARAAVAAAAAAIARARFDDQSTRGTTVSRKASRHPLAAALMSTRYVSAIAVNHAALDAIMIPSSKRVKPSAFTLLCRVTSYAGSSTYVRTISDSEEPNFRRNLAA